MESLTRRSFIKTSTLALAGGVLPKARVNRLLQALWQLDQLDDVGDIVRLCRIPRRGQA